VVGTVAFVTEELVHYGMDRGVATITLDSPANRNALSSQLVAELGTHLDTALSTSEVRVIHLTATGPVFCAGADLKAAGSAATDAFPRILATLMDSPKPVVVELNGPARAGGIGLVAAADIAIAPEDATFAFTEVRIGVIPAIIAVPLARTVSANQLRRWFLTGETFTASEASAAGLLSAAVPAGAVRERTIQTLDDLRRAAPGALAGIKPLLARVAGADAGEALAWASQESARYFASPEAAEGLAAFREKRPPAWSHLRA
jgi:methylglutaconyl-CoA hydratase